MAGASCLASPGSNLWCWGPNQTRRHCWHPSEIRAPADDREKEEHQKDAYIERFKQKLSLEEHLISKTL